MEFIVLLVVFLPSLFLVEALTKPLFINCGCNSSITVEGRQWVGDSSPGQSFTLSSVGVAAAAAASTIAEDPIYQTARIFNTSTSFDFTVPHGNYFIRLHFRPFDFGSFDANGSSFDLLANDLKLLSKFNAPGEIGWKNARSNSNASSLLKEYSLCVNLTQLRIEFVPELGSFAFVNALELIPAVDELLFPSSSGIETMYRLNVGGREIKPSEDGALWRKWNSDEQFMFSVNAAYNISNTSTVTYSSPINDTAVFAPLLVYETARTMTDNQVVERRFNVSWRFDVDPNFDYLIRLHFSELVYDKPNQRIFRIYINNKTAAENFDVFVRAGGKNKAYHQDYVEAISPKVDSLWVQLGPNSLSSGSGADALLNGVEIFKLSRNGILAHAHPRISAAQGNKIAQKPKNKTLWPAAAAAAAVGLVGIASLLYVGLLHRLKKTPPAKKSPPGSTKNAAAIKSSLSSNKNRVGRRFSVAEIKIATRNFDEELVIGAGGFGKVYRGEINEGVTVAIKRANRQSEQGVREFETEIEMLSKLRHRHLASMIGFCDEQGEMVLVYEYMANGTLRSHLLGGDRPALTWRQRVEACIGAARGLHYLHTGAERAIIHRDVKSTNILLDENFMAKVADFGLSKDGPAVDRTHVSTAVKGSFGYLDPEYFRRQQLTEKSDVYSFGVVLLEVVCARPVIDPSLPREQISLAEWALQQPSAEQIVDQRLKEEEGFSPESVARFVEIAEKCLADEGKRRPTMGEVLWLLENVS
ncbi:hypothetical protein ZIOFF_042463 [Zingiber officinale]|uniref:Protein kinase domain-containing protein n=1 Tax=Zingiber officinale TaxID=94328 RepID=A0A8J5G9I4_ZINOF|nr:hypothetical protein ZIOFF_042463 [Zingiber officinale]